jgi:predicted dehydrogenase
MGLKWGILGTGNIARKFAKDVQQLSDHKIVAVGSRSAESAQKFGTEFNTAKQYDSYAGLVADTDVEAVYISLPNHLHKEWTIKCAEHKKHVLCEKPLTVNRRETDELLEAVKHHDVFMMEAFMYRCHPQIFKVRELLAQRAIGEVRMVHAHFNYNMGPVYTNIRLSNPAAGGGMMDVGCYAVSMARLAAGCEPIECRAVGKIGPVSRVDEQAAGTLLFPNGVVAAISCATQVQADTFVTIFGSEGSIHIPVPWSPPAKGARLIVKRKTGPEELSIDANLPVFALEAMHVAENIAKRQAPAMPWADSVGNMAALDALRASMGLVFDCER